MTGSAGIAVANDRIRDHAERLAAGPVDRGALALAFTESRASSADVHVEGRNFYPPMLADIGSASSSVHINQFGFKPGVVGEAFAEALVEKAAEGVPVRLVVDGRIGWVGGAGIEDHFQDGRFHDLLLRVVGPVVSQLQLVFVASFCWLGGAVPIADVATIFPEL